MGLDDTLAAIDAVTLSCVQCGRWRGDSPSDDFCSETCQRRWMQARSVALPGIALDRPDEPACRMEITADVSRARLRAALRRLHLVRHPKRGRT